MLLPLPVLASAHRHKNILRRSCFRGQTIPYCKPDFNHGLLEGKVVGECHERLRHQEFLKFLRRLNTEFPGDVPLHLIMDNYGTHKHAKVKAWLKRNPRFVPHFVPTSSSWMNLVERWFGHLDNKAIRRGVFRSIADLQAAINAYLAEHNVSPKPFVWTKSAEAILAKLDRCPVPDV